MGAEGYKAEIGRIVKSVLWKNFKKTL